MKEIYAMSEFHPLYTQGQELATQLFGNPGGDFADIPFGPEDDMEKTLVTWLFGYLLKERSELPLRVKVLSIIAMSTATSQHDMLKRWIPAARNAGCARREVQETIITMIVYAGWPAARSALEILRGSWPADLQST
jgi:alkylhydroperoxidase/carboxymuconolactone decarboxylase family protein YurZ